PGAVAVVVIRLVRLWTLAFGKILGVIRVGVGVPVLERARADARPETGTRTVGGQARDDPDHYENGNHDGRYPRLPLHDQTPPAGPPGPWYLTTTSPNRPD